MLLVDLDADRAAITRDEIIGQGGRAEVCLADVASEAACREAVAAATGRFGRLDVLVNNAATLAGGPLDTIEEADWHRALDVNLGGAVWMSKHAVVEMARGGGGAIVNISSIAAERGSGHVAYAASKAGDAGADPRHRRDARPAGHPRQRHPPGAHLHADGLGHALGAARAAAAHRALGTRATRRDVARAAVFLASDDARWINGACLPVDAGNLASMTVTVIDRLGASS